LAHSTKDIQVNEDTSVRFLSTKTEKNWRYFWKWNFHQQISAPLARFRPRPGAPRPPPLLRHGILWKMRTRNGMNIKSASATAKQQYRFPARPGSFCCLRVATFLKYFPIACFGLATQCARRHISGVLVFWAGFDTPKRSRTTGHEACTDTGLFTPRAWSTLTKRSPNWKQSERIRQRSSPHLKKKCQNRPTRAKFPKLSGCLTPKRYFCFFPHAVASLVVLKRYGRRRERLLNLEIGHFSS